MKSSWIFLTAVRREPFFGGGEKLSKIGVPISRIIFLEAIDGGTRVALDDGSTIDVKEDVIEIANLIMRSESEYGL